MDSAARARRTRSVFRPCKSYLGKKSAVDVAAQAHQLHLQRRNAAQAHLPHHVPIMALTVHLMHTYHSINVAFFERNQAATDSSPAAAAAAAAGAAAAAAAAAAVTMRNGVYAAEDSHFSDHCAVTALDDSAFPSDSQIKSTFSSNTNHTNDSVTINSNSNANSNSNNNAAHQPNGNTNSLKPMQYCDSNYDYIVSTGEMFNNRYMLEKVIGRGSFGQVVRAYDTADYKHVAIKIIKNHSLYVEQAMSEVRMTSYLNRIDPTDSHSIMRLRDKFIFRGHQCLVLELLSFSLYDLLRSTQFFGVSLNLVRKFCKQILSCLSFLARPDVNIAHCDLKPENVLLRHPQRSAIKVVDFGASCRISDSMFTYVQSRFYRAPEVILGLPYATQVDVWSLGCMLIELHTGFPLFAGKDEADQIAIIVQRLGLPPVHMLEEGTKSTMFFEKDEKSGEWRLKPNPLSSHADCVPGSKPIESFVDFHTGTSNGRRKRASGGHSEGDYDVFLSLARDMLQYDPEVRITAEEALRDTFVRGAAMRSGRESPPPIPEMSEVDGMENKEVETGRKAPVQRRRKEVGMDGLDHHTDAWLRDSPEERKSAGGPLQKSKSEPAMERVSNHADEFIFSQSGWAEEVGIEPPPWRAGGLGCRDDWDSGVWRVCGRGRMVKVRSRRLPPAGSGRAILETDRSYRDTRGDAKTYQERELSQVSESFLTRGTTGGEGEAAGRGIGHQVAFGHGQALAPYLHRLGLAI